MGADHTAGFVAGKNLSILGGTMDPFGRAGQVDVSREAQIRAAFLDCTGLCLFAWSAAGDIPEAGEALLRMINAKLGTQLKDEDCVALGVAVLKAEREFNRKVGFTNTDDRLARMFYEEPLPPHNKTVVITDEDMDSTFDF